MSTKLLKQLLLITLGTAIMAFGIINFAVTNQMAEGGFTGITIILFHLFGLSTGVSNLLLNIPMLIIGYRQFSKKGFWLTIFGTCMLSVFLSLFETLGHIVPPLPNDMMISAIGMGVCVGTGLGIIFNAGGTTGGVDIIAKIIKDKMNIKQFSAPILTQVIEAPRFFPAEEYHQHYLEKKGLFSCHSLKKN